MNALYTREGRDLRAVAVVGDVRHTMRAEADGQGGVCLSKQRVNRALRWPLPYETLDVPADLMPALRAMLDALVPAEPVDSRQLSLIDARAA